MRNSDFRFFSMNKISDKTEFILAFAALIIGLGVFSDNLKQININLGFGNFSFWNIGLVIFSLLFLSIYLYALDYVRYGIPRIENWKLFKTLQYIAHFLYSFAIIIPLLVILLWIFVFILGKLPLEKYVSYISITISMLVSAGSLALSLFQFRKKEKIVREEISERASLSLSETDRLVEKKEWRLVIMEAFRLLELMLRNKAEEIGIDAARLPFIRQVQIFIEKGLFTKPQAVKLSQVRELRNLAAHSEINITREQAMYVTDVIDEIGNSLTYATFASGLFEKKVGNALQNLFPKHHIFRQFNVGKGKRVDFIAEGPEHTYYIEAKVINFPAMIDAAAKQIEDLFHNENDRGLLIIPTTSQAIDLTNSKIKVLYFDIQNETFVNQKEILKWIYK